MILGLGLLAAAGLSSVLWLLPALRFLRNYEHRLAASGSTINRLTENMGAVELHIYKPERQNGATLIIVPGLHPEGIHDSRFIAFAETCAKAGFQVVAPDLREFRDFRITNQSIQILRSLMDDLPGYLPDDTVNRIGMLGISYGAGPVFLLAAERKFDFIVSIGGYYNLLHALEYSFTGKHPGGDQRSAHEWGRLIFALNHIDELAPSADAQVLRNSLSLRLELKVDEAEALENELSDDAKYLLNGIVQGLSEDQKDVFIEITKRKTSEAAALSPASVLSDIDPETRIYLLHGTNDDSIPYEETIELQHALERAGLKSRCLITPALTHVDFTKVTELWELVKLLHWQRLLLSER